MSRTLLVFDTHPVQYRVPVWQAMEEMSPGSVHVVYASDCSVKGHSDNEFGRVVAWDIPMLDGYDYTILNCEKGIPMTSWGSLTGKGVRAIIREKRPDAILLTGLTYQFYIAAYIEARKLGIPVWLRCETQDSAYTRSALKSAGRSLVYRLAYLALDRIFYIGELNRTHYLRHSVGSARLKPARYGTPDKFSCFSEDEKIAFRRSARIKAGIAGDAFVIGFSGKFITKKNPDILFAMLSYLPEELRGKIHLYFMGSGELQEEMDRMADEAVLKYGVKTFFAGFVNQSQLPSHYLAMDIMVLPSRRMGETWGLVANESMQSGCSVIVSDAVGCSADFLSWERFRVFPEGSAEGLAAQVVSLAKFTRDFDWAKPNLELYSMEATAESLLLELKQ